mmetsp:Transcript_9732/g.40876  ORF Transcript_9732/g.40876 Transcript_9732/m.40876 type:complete len:306 (+) Transcript_9732:1999-2916(+)
MLIIFLEHFDVVHVNLRGVTPPALTSKVLTRLSSRLAQRRAEHAVRELVCIRRDGVSASVHAHQPFREITVVVYVVPLRRKRAYPAHPVLQTLIRASDVGFVVRPEIPPVVIKLVTTPLHRWHDPEQTPGVHVVHRAPTGFAVDARPVHSGLIGHCTEERMARRDRGVDVVWRRAPSATHVFHRNRSSQARRDHRHAVINTTQRPPTTDRRKIAVLVEVLQETFPVLSRARLETQVCVPSVTSDGISVRPVVEKGNIPIRPPVFVKFTDADEIFGGLLVDPSEDLILEDRAQRHAPLLGHDCVAG